MYTYNVTTHADSELCANLVHTNINPCKSLDDHTPDSCRLINAYQKNVVL